MAESVLSEDIRLQRMQTEEKLFPTNEKYEQYTWLEKKKKKKLTSRCFFLSGVPQGFNPPEKLAKLRQTIDLMLYDEINRRFSSDH